jgi:hypothetical protein
MKKENFRRIKWMKRKSKSENTAWVKISIFYYSCQSELGKESQAYEFKMKRIILLIKSNFWDNGKRI